MKIFIGCDVGTSSTKAVAVDENGKIIAEGSKRYGIVQKSVNWAEQDPDIWLDGAVSSIRDVIAGIDESSVAGICISALYGGTGALLDGDMKVIRPALIWMDRRADKESAMVRETVGAEKILEVTDNGTDSYFGYTKLLWVRENEPENWNRIRLVLPANSYIVYRMTGRVTCDYSSAGNFGGVYDYRKHEWSDEMCGLIGMPREWFPDPLMKPYDIAGTINADYMEKMGLKHEVPLCVGTIDCISSMLSANAVRLGDNAAVLGTSLNFGIIHDGLTCDDRIVSMPYALDPERISYTYGGASTAGALPRWFVTQFMGNDSSKEYNEIEQEILDADIPAGCGGLTILPYFMGERTPVWDENATGVFFGVTLSQGRAHFYKALLESVAFSLRHISESMKLGSAEVKKIVLVGGGSRSKIWKQIFADVMGLPVSIPTNPVEAPLGDAFLAAYAAGAKKDFAEIGEWIEFEEPCMPDPERHEAYNRYFEIYKELYPQLRDLMLRRAELLKQ